MFRRSFVAASLGLALASSAGATPYAGEFLSVGVGARPLALGGAYVALVEDASASYWNPAALPRNDQRQFVYMHSERFGDLVNYDSGSIVFRTKQGRDGSKSAFGLSFLITAVPGIKFNTTDEAILREIESGTDGIFGTNDPDGSEGNGRLEPGERLDLDLLAANTEEVSDRQMGFLLSYGKTQVFRDDVSMGASVKFVRKSISDYSAWGLGLDVGALWDLNENWSFGANLQDVTTTFLTWSGTPSEPREFITPTAKIGTAYTRDVPQIAGAITVVADLDLRFEDEVGSSFSLGGMPGDVRAGVEYTYRERVSFRLGSERLGGDHNPFTAGAGLQVRRFSFDYAYRNHSELDDVHRISGGILF